MVTVGCIIRLQEEKRGFNVQLKKLSETTRPIAFFPLPKAEGYRFGVVCPAVYLSRCPSVTNLLGLYLKDYYSSEHET